MLHVCRSRSARTETASSAKPGLARECVRGFSTLEPPVYVRQANICSPPALYPSLSTRPVFACATRLCLRDPYLSVRLSESAPLVFVNASCLCSRGLSVSTRILFLYSLGFLLHSLSLSTQPVFACAACVCLRGLCLFARLVFCLRGLSRLVGVTAARRGLRGMSV
jgi:hypothetical protein